MKDEIGFKNMWGDEHPPKTSTDTKAAPPPKMEIDASWIKKAADDVTKFQEGYQSGANTMTKPNPNAAPPSAPKKKDNTGTYFVVAVAVIGLGLGTWAAIKHFKAKKA